MVLTMRRRIQFPFVCFLLLDVCGAAGGKFFYPEEKNMLTKNLDLGQYYDWMGSLTTPGCNLGVKWILSGTILDISIEQLARMVKAMTFAGNFRMPQPIGDRIIGPPAMPGDSDYEDGMGDSTVYIEDEDVKNVMLGLGISVVVLVCFLCAVVMKLACCPDVFTNTVRGDQAI